MTMVNAMLAVTAMAVLELPPSNENSRNSEGDFAVLKDGRILYVYSHFMRGTGEDHDPAILASRISSDGGRTWSGKSVEVVANEGGQNVMSVSLLRLKDGALALFYLRKNSSDDCRPVMRVSRDEGVTWGAPAVCVPDSEAGYYVLNNCRAERLSNGRIILPLALHERSATGEGTWERAAKMVCWFSDDEGATWRRGAAPFYAYDEKGAKVITQEPGAVELKDGTVLMYARSDRGRQWFFRSSDHGETWTKGEPGTLFSPLSPATVKRLSNGDLVAVWNDHEFQPELTTSGPWWANGIRTPLTVGVSKDEGRTWPIRRTLESDAKGWYCYFAVLELDGNLLIGACAKDLLSHSRIYRMPLDWLYEPGAKPSKVRCGGYWAEEAGIRKYMVGRCPEESESESTAAYGRPVSNRVFRIEPSMELYEVNDLDLRPGDTVLFRRGGVWRGQLQPRSGKPGHPIVYGAYGEGPKPVLEPSYDRSAAWTWRPRGEGLWMTETRADADIGNVVFDHAKGPVKCAFKRDRRDQLANDLDFWCDPKSYAVWLRSDRNPAERFKSVELCEKIHCIEEAKMHDVVYDGLHLRYSAAHGIGGDGVKRITVRNCDISWIGGGYLYYDKKGNGVRYGNGIEFWSDCEDVLVESNRVWEVWDAALTNQSNMDGAVQRNAVWRGNEVWNCEYSYEYWQQGQGARTENVRVEGNRFRDAGKGWGHRQRWNPNAAHLMFYDTTAETKDFVVTGNVFSRSENTLVRLFNDWRAALTMADNVWETEGETICRFHGRPTKDLVYRYPDRLDQMHDDNLSEIESQGSGARVFKADDLEAFLKFMDVRDSGAQATVRTESVGPVELVCAKPNGWTFALSSEKLPDGREAVTLRMSAPAVSVPPECELLFSVSGANARHVWSDFEPYAPINPNHFAKYRRSSQLASGTPIAVAFDEDGTSVVGMAATEVFEKVLYSIAFNDHTCALEGKMKLFSKNPAPRQNYEMKLLVDRRGRCWDETVQAASAWILSAAGLKSASVPEGAYDALYSTWYAYWQDVHASELEREAELAAACGMKTMILDDGWQMERTKRYYSKTGDWQPVASRFPDMKAHVAKVRSFGLKYMLWFSVPFVGEDSAAFTRFKGKYLCFAGEACGAWVLDPRFPEVRQYLIDTYVKAVRDWGFDGLKLDFIDRFVLPDVDPAVAENYAGRDCRSVLEATDRLMKDVLAALQRVKPDVLVEFRQHYMGPAMLQYGNMMRALDCPADPVVNRRRIADLRLTSGPLAVHADMLMWCPDDDAAGAAHPIISALFGVVQYSMVLDRLPETHRDVVRHWIRFAEKHREALLKGRFTAHHPELGYSILESESAAERITAVYAGDTLVRVRTDKPVVLVNGSREDGVLADFGTESATVSVFDTFGRACGEPRTATGLLRLPIPKSGYAEIK